MPLINRILLHADPASMSYTIEVHSDHKDINGFKLKVRIKSPRNFDHAGNQFRRLAKSDLFLDSLLNLHKSGTIEIMKPQLKKLIVRLFPDNFDVIKKLKEFNATR